MERAYNELISDLLSEGDFESAQAALRKKVDEGDGSACALLGLYNYLNVFPGCDRKDAFQYWRQGAALGDFDCKGLSLLDRAELDLDEDSGIIVLTIKDQTAREILKCAAKGNGYIYELLLSWMVTDDFYLEVSDKLFLRILLEGVEYFKQTEPLFLAYRVFEILWNFNQIPHTDADYERLFRAYRDLLEEGFSGVCYAFSAEILTYCPDFVGREELLKWISCLKEPLPKEYHYFMGALKDRDCLMTEVIIHAEEMLRLDTDKGFGDVGYAYCLIKGKGVTKDLREAERLLGTNDSSFGLVMRAHCRMFIDPEHPDIEGAVALLDEADETMDVYWDRMLYLLYAESKHALTAPLKRLLAEEMEDAEADEYDSYLFFQGVRLALKPQVDMNKVAKYFLDERVCHHDLGLLWVCGKSEDLPLDFLVDLIRDDHIDTDYRYHLAFKLVLLRAQKNDAKGVKEALQWVDSLGGKKYTLRNRCLRHLLAIVGEPDRYKRQPFVNRFLEEYDELQAEGLANYLRVWLEVCHFRMNRKQLKRFVDLTVASQDSYAIICVGHVLMHLRNPKDVLWGEEVEQAGDEIAPLCRVDWMIEALTGGSYMDMAL